MCGINAPKTGSIAYPCPIGLEKLLVQPGRTALAIVYYSRGPQESTVAILTGNFKGYGEQILGTCQ